MGEQFGVTVTLYTGIHDVLVSKLGRDTSYAKICRGSRQFLQENPRLSLR
jgi:hypothetical protein